MRGLGLGLALTLAAALAVGIAALAIQPSAGAEAAKSRVIDRKLVCATGLQGGARVILLSARSAFRKGDRLEWLGHVGIATAGQPVPSRRNYRPTLAGVTAGWPPPPALTSGGLGFENKLCAATRSPVAFSRRGLTGGPVSQLGDEFTCVVPRSLLIRVRAVFREATVLELLNKGAFYSADGRIEVGKIAVRTLTGKPLVYADVLDSGKARLLAARSCS